MIFAFANISQFFLLTYLAIRCIEPAIRFTIACIGEIDTCYGANTALTGIRNYAQSTYVNSRRGKTPYSSCKYLPAASIGVSCYTLVSSACQVAYLQAGSDDGSAIEQPTETEISRIIGKCIDAYHPVILVATGISPSD